MVASWFRAGTIKNRISVGSGHLALALALALQKKLCGNCTGYGLHFRNIVYSVKKI